LASDCRNCAGMEQRPFLSTLLTYVDRKMAIGLTNAPLSPLNGVRRREPRIRPNR